LRRLFILACGFALVCGAAAQATTKTAGSADAEALHYLGGLVHRYELSTWHWQRVIGVPRTPSRGRTLAGMSVTGAQAAVRVWRRRAEAIERRATHPPHLHQWLCIYRFEHHPAQGWQTNTGNGYYGGLQMNIGFQRRYGGTLLRAKGTADRWTPLEQIWVAERARRTRGFWPWPNTARACGLI
jgi:hypothetical protein